MRGKAAVAIMLAALVAGCGMEGTRSPEAVEAEARAAIATFFEAMNSSDADGVLAVYSANDYVHVACTEYHEKALFERIVRSYYRGERDPGLRYEIRAIRALGADAAFVSAAGASADAEGLFWTWVLEREDGELRIVHEHESWTNCPPPRESFHGPGAEPDTAGPAADETGP